MKTALLWIVLSLATGVAQAGEAAPAAHATLPPALAKAVAAFDRAQVAGDTAAFRRLLADDYVLFNSAGQRQDKASFIADFTQGLKLQPFVVEDEVVRAWSGGAVLSGTANLSGTSGGKPFETRLHFADVWRERDGVWQVIYTEARRVDAP